MLLKVMLITVHNKAYVAVLFQHPRIASLLNI